MKDLKRYVQNITKPAIRKNGFITPQIIFDWPLIVGDYLAKYTTPLKVVFPAKKNSDGCLHIEVIGAQAVLVQQLQQEIIEKIATYCGFKAIIKIKLIHTKELPAEIKTKKPIKLTPEAANRLDKMLESVEDDDLKQRLKAIGTHILGKNHE